MTIDNGAVSDDRNRDYSPPHFDAAGGKLGETPVLWELRMAYAWSEQFQEEDPEWDQCCTCWVFALSDGEARQKAWEKFNHPGSVMPEAVASCYPLRFRHDGDDADDARRAAQAIEAAAADETGTGSAVGESAVRQDAPENTPLSSMGGSYAF